MKHRQFIRNASLCLSLALPLSLLGAGACCGSKDAKDGAGVGEKAKVQPPKDMWAFLPEVVATVGNKQISKADFVKEISVALKICDGQVVPPNILGKSSESRGEHGGQGDPSRTRRQSRSEAYARVGDKRVR